LIGWGRNQNGILGNNLASISNTSTPIAITNFSNWKSINANLNLSNSFVGVRHDGTAWTWGDNAYGQLAQNDIINRSTPTQIGTEFYWIQVSTSISTGLLKNDGTLWVAGNNAYGNLGLNDTINRSSLVQILNKSDWTQISSSRYGTFAIDANNKLWGSGGLINSFTVNVSSMTQIASSVNFKSIVGNSSIFAITNSGELYAWGYNIYGQIGNNSTVDVQTPIQIGTDTNWLDVRNSDIGCTLGLKTDGTLWSWGRATNGFLANNNNTISYSSPIQVGNDNTWSRIAVSSYTWYALKSDGTMWRCGGPSNMFWMGNTPTPQNLLAVSSPVQLIGDNGWLDLAVSYQTGYGLRGSLPAPTMPPTPSPTPSPSISPTVTASPTPSPSESPTPSPTESPTPSPSPSESLTPSPTATPTSTPTPSPSESPSPTPSPSATCTPVPLPVTSGLVGWFDASNTATINGGTPTNGVQVSSWGNSTTNATWTGMQQATSVKQPTWFSDGTVAGSYVLFDNTAGANADGMTTNGAYSLSGACTIVVMEDAPASISPSHRTVQSSSINALISLNQYGGPTPIGCFYGASIVSGYQSGTGKHNGIMTKSAANAIKYYVDGTDRTSGTPTSTSNWAQVCFGGAGANANEPANTKVLEVIVYDRELSAAEVTQVSDYLQCKWTNPGPTPQPTTTPTPTPT
jgi:hypothetical protein